MGNYIKPPKDERISARVSSSTIRQLSKLPYSYGEVLEIGAEHLSNEKNRLSWEKGELELEIASLRKKLAEREAKLVAINNRLRVIDPHLLDKETLTGLIEFAANDFALEVYSVHGVGSLDRIGIDKIKHSVYSTAREWGYDADNFYNLVVDQLKKLCHTGMSDNSARVLNDIV